MTKGFRFGSLQDQHGHILFTAIKRFQHWTRGTSTFFKYVFTSHLHGLIFRNNETIATQNIHRRHSHVSIPHHLHYNWIETLWYIFRSIHFSFSFHCPPTSDTSFFQIQEPFLSHIRFPNRYHFNIFRISQFLFL